MANSWKGRWRRQEAKGEISQVEKRISLGWEHPLVVQSPHYTLSHYFSSHSVQFSHSVVSDSLRPHGPQDLSITNSQSLLKLMSIESVMPSNHLIVCRPLLLPASIFLSIRVFSNESVLCIGWPKYWSFSFKSVLPMNIHDWFLLWWTAWISLQSKGLSRVFFNTTDQKHQFFGAHLSL